MDLGSRSGVALELQTQQLALALELQTQQLALRSPSAPATGARQKEASWLQDPTAGAAWVLERWRESRDLFRGARGEGGC